MPAGAVSGDFRRRLLRSGSRYRRRLVKLWNAWLPWNAARQARKAASRSPSSAPPARPLHLGCRI